MTAPTPEPLPGLEDLAGRRPAALEKAVRRTIAALSSSGRVTEADAARTALALTMADIITAKRASGRMSTIGMDAKVLMDLLDGLVGEAGGVDGELASALEEWAKADAGTAD